MNDPNIEYLTHEVMVSAYNMLRTFKYVDIISIVCEKPYVKIITKKENVKVYYNLNKFCENLPDYFLQCNSSTYINVMNFDSIEKGKSNYIVCLQNKFYDISRRRYQDFKNRFEDIKVKLSEEGLCGFCKNCKKC